MAKKIIFQNHHVCYNPEVVRRIRKGVHQCCNIISRFNHLTDEEINAIMLACELKRQFSNSLVKEKQNG